MCTYQGGKRDVDSGLVDTDDDEIGFRVVLEAFERLLGQSGVAGLTKSSCTAS